MFNKGETGQDPPRKGVEIFQRSSTGRVCPYTGILFPVLAARAALSMLVCYNECALRLGVPVGWNWPPCGMVLVSAGFQP